MGTHSSIAILQLDKELASCTNLSDGVKSFLENLVYESEQQKNFSKPMMWIGFYIAVASLFCILPMVADLLHGLKNKKLWFPCKYFTLNAASLTLIAVAMKLPMDLNNPMPTDLDLAAKLGSMAFMCTIMANLLPSLATMDGKELLTNITALGILVITLIVNVCIQIGTGVVHHLLHPIGDRSVNNQLTGETDLNLFAAIFYVVMLLCLLMIHTCSALIILESKQKLEPIYTAGHEKALNDLELQQPRSIITVDKLEQHVRNHWFMAWTGSPQFMTVCSATTSVSGLICLASTLVHVSIIVLTIIRGLRKYGSDYKSSVVVILITQSIGIILGTIAPLSRCFACFAFLSFKVSKEWIFNHIYKVESYGTHIQRLCDWKQSSVPFKFRSRRWKIVIHVLKVMILNLLIVFQLMIVAACKIITVIPIYYVFNYVKCFHGASSIVLVINPAQSQHNINRNQYVLQLQENMQLSDRTLTRCSISMTHLIERATKQQPNNLMRLLDEFSGFEGLYKYDTHQDPPKYVDCWSLAVETLTAIAISLPNIENNMVDNLLRSVSEGLTYVTLVEETLNTTAEYARIQKAARTLWLDVELYQKWLGYKLQSSHAYRLYTTKEIVQWFWETAQTAINSNESSFYKLVSANSMYRITQTILASRHVNIDQVSQDELFKQLSTMISNILAACLTNLPQVIAMKCHTNVIEKREESVHAAAQLLGETTLIINNLQGRQLPSLDRDELPYLVKWRDCSLQISP